VNFIYQLGQKPGKVIDVAGLRIFGNFFPPQQTSNCFGVNKDDFRQFSLLTPVDLQSKLF
jgi:hypothetical protein